MAHKLKLTCPSQLSYIMSGRGRGRGRGRGGGRGGGRSGYPGMCIV
jgi:hypothetical protein